MGIGQKFWKKAKIAKAKKNFCTKSRQNSLKSVALFTKVSFENKSEIKSGFEKKLAGNLFLALDFSTDMIWIDSMLIISSPISSKKVFLLPPQFKKVRFFDFKVDHGGFLRTFSLNILKIQ